MTKFPKSVLKFYLSHLYDCAKAWPWLFALLSIIDTAGHSIVAAFLIKMVVGTLENSPALEALSTIIYIAILYFIVRSIAIASAVLRWAVFDNCIKYRAYNKISEYLYDYVFKQTVEFYANSMPGKIDSQIDSIASGFFETILTIFGSIIAITGSFIISFGGLFEIGWQYLVVILIAVLMRIIWGICCVKKALNTSANTSKTSNHLHGRLLDALSNFISVKSFTNEKWEQKCARPYRKEYEKTARAGHAASRWFWAPGNYMTDVLGMTALIILCGYMYATGQSSIADISFAISIFVGISAISFEFIWEIRYFIEVWGKSVGSYTTLITPIKVTDAPDATKLTVRSGGIQIKNLSFKYVKKYVLKNVSIDIAPGERVGIVGLSGSGKTTLVNLLMRFYDPTNGAIYVDGADIKYVTQESLRKNISFIPQDSTMFNRTIRENIKYGNIRATDKQIKAAAKKASADKFILSAPKQYDTYVGDRGIKLSGGQRQRIAIARAFLKNAPILILDEATSALDSQTEAVIQESFDKLSHGRTTIVIAHRLSTLRSMDRLIVLDEGKIVETGNHASLLRKNGVYAKLWKMQSGGFIQE